MKWNGPAERGLRPITHKYKRKEATPPFNSSFLCGAWAGQQRNGGISFTYRATAWGHACSSSSSSAAFDSFHETNCCRRRRTALIHLFFFLHCSFRNLSLFAFSSSLRSIAGRPAITHKAKSKGEIAPFSIPEAAPFHN